MVLTKVMLFLFLRRFCQENMVSVPQIAFYGDFAESLLGKFSLVMLMMMMFMTVLVKMVYHDDETVNSPFFFLRPPR